jgi:hypothetical protein
MTDAEKTQQIGAATLEYQSAKQECAHIDTKVKAVFAAYSEAGDSMNQSRGTITEPQVIDGKVKIGFRQNDLSIAANLLNQSELAALLTTRDAARHRLAEARKTLEALGITSLV